MVKTEDGKMFKIEVIDSFSSYHLETVDRQKDFMWWSKKILDMIQLSESF